MADSDAVLEIKKERLARHLDQVEGYLVQWLDQLHTPPPYSRELEQTLQTIHVTTYYPPLEEDPDVNHMLRKHLGSREFWRHRAEWMRMQEGFARLANELVGVGQSRMEAIAQAENIKPRLWFLNAALEDAFTLCVGGDLGAPPEPDSYGGVLYRSVKIEEASPPGDLPKVQRALKELTNRLRKCAEMTELSSMWTQMRGHEQSMSKIGGDAIKASDIFYPCRFCRKMFR